MNKKTIILLVVFFCLMFARKASAQFSQFGREGEISEKLLNDLNAAKYDDVRSAFALLYKNTVPREMIAQNWESIQSILGNFQRIKSITKFKNSVNGYDVIRVRCEMLKENVNVEITFNEDNKVVFLYFEQ
jgi:hypothetical protein